MIAGLFEGIALSTIVSVVSILGMPGLILIFWHVDHRRYDRERTEHKAEMVKVLARYDKDMATVTRFYEDNVLLVKDYSRLSGELANIIHLNTQVQTRLVEKINNNHSCPIVRKKGSDDD